MSRNERSMLIIKTPGKARCGSQTKNQVRFMCRVCLTKNNDVMHDLCDKSVDFETPQEITIHEALEKVTASKVKF